MKPFALLLLLLLAMANAASEPSAFGAGNLDAPEPYGLTATEKSIYENRKTLQRVLTKAHENDAQLQSLRERLDGLQTIIEGLNEKAQSNKVALGELTQGLETEARLRDEKIAALESSISANSSNITAIKSLLETLAAQIDTINSDYVSKEEYNRLVAEVNAFKRETVNALKSMASVPSRKKTGDYSSMPSKQLLKEAKRQYDKLYFKKAIPMFEELIRRNYKPAYAHFMIGEMWHYRKKWAKALSYYKASAKLYDDASYMPKLMLHSAECMLHTGDKRNAEKFLKALMAKYPSSKEARQARRLLNTFS